MLSDDIINKKVWVLISKTKWETCQLLLNPFEYIWFFVTVYLITDFLVIKFG